MKRPDYQGGGVSLYCGNCVAVMRSMAACSVDTIITDPPYGLEFMGQEWDAPWKYSFGEYGFTDGSWRRPGPRFKSNRNPVCRSCRRHRRGSTNHTPCSCEAPDFDDIEHHLKDLARLQAWNHAWAQECLHVLKPGGMLLAFGGTRTHHRLMCAIEDAGFEIRDCLMWLYGSGFPKSWDISKAIDRVAGAKRGTIGISSGPNHSRYQGERYRRRRSTRFGTVQDQPALTAPATSAAEKWNGWGTGLKPAWEPIIVAMKPLDGTFARNALKHGVAGLNIDGARIGSEVIVINRYEDVHKKGAFTRPGDASSTHAGEPFRRFQSPGRWPANVLLSHHPECEYLEHEQVNSNGHYPSKRGVGGIGVSGHGGQTGLVEHHTIGEIVESWRCHSHCPIAMLDKQSGRRKTSYISPHHQNNRSGGFLGQLGHPLIQGYNDTGGASRFFYCAKASKTERNYGLPTGETNDHPTIKPLKLMEYLCKLTATPIGGIILDPFAGSGTTLLAARNVGRECIGIECDRAYVKIAEAKLTYLIRQKKLRGVMPHASRR